MRDIFNMDGGLFRFLSKVADMFILNILFIICCIPIVTIGAASTALVYVFLKMKDGEEGYISRTFFRSFKQNFKQSTIIWLILLVLAVILGIDHRMVQLMEGTMAKVMQVVVYIGMLVWMMEFTFVFPIQSRFYNSVKNTMRNALLLALANFPRALAMIAITIAAVWVTFLNGTTFWYGILVWIMFGFSILAWTNAALMYGVIKKMMPPEETDEAETEEISEPETRN